MTARYTQRTCPWYNHCLVENGNDNDVSESGGDGDAVGADGDGDNNDSGDADGGDGDGDHRKKSNGNSLPPGELGVDAGIWAAQAWVDRDSGCDGRDDDERECDCDVG